MPPEMWDGWTPLEPPPPPPPRDYDAEWWAQLYRECPLAFWLDPKLWPKPKPQKPKAPKAQRVKR